jgi:hypothetical protein
MDIAGSYADIGAIERTRISTNPKLELVDEPKPYAEVLVELLPTSDGGRAHAVVLDDAGYRPHLRVEGGDYLGVEFVDGPAEPLIPGQKSYATVRFLYWPEVCYEALTVGTSFEILEGSRVVGRGCVTRR